MGRRRLAVCSSVLRDGFVGRARGRRVQQVVLTVNQHSGRGLETPSEPESRLAAESLSDACGRPQTWTEASASVMPRGLESLGGSLCCFVHSRRTAYCAEWDFVNDTTQEYARLDFFGLAPAMSTDGHANPEHKPREGWSNDTVTVGRV